MIRRFKQWPRLTYGVAFLVLVALVVAMRPSPVAAQDKPVVLARLTGITITSDELAQKAHERHFLRDDPYNDPELFKKLLDDLILDTLVGLEARKVDLSEEWGFRARLRIEETNAALQAFQRVDLIPSLYFDSASIDSYYQAHVDRYTAPRDQRKIRQITVYKKGYQIPKSYITYVDPVYEGWDPKRKIDSIYTRLANGEDFEELVIAHSEELKAKASRGNLGWLSPKSIADTELVKPFFETPLHMITKPFETEYGWIIAQATDERKAGPAPIDDLIRADIVYGLQETKGKKIASALTDSLVDNGTIEYNDALMNAPDSLIAPGALMALINKRDTLWGAGYKFRKHQVPEVRTKPFLTREEKEELLRPLVRSIFLHEFMRELGYLKYPEVTEMRARKVRQYAEELVRARFSKSTYAPDSAAIEAYYHNHIGDYTPEQRHQVETVRLTDRDSAQQVMDAWQQGTRPQNARVQMAGPSDLPAPVWNKLAAVTPNSYVGPVNANGVYWVMHLVRILPPRPIKDVWATIDATLRQNERLELQRRWEATMARRYGLVRYDDRLGQVQLPSRHDPRFVEDTTAAAS